MATHSRILDWRIPWTEEPGRLQSLESIELDMTEWPCTQRSQKSLDEYTHVTKASYIEYRESSYKSIIKRQINQFKKRQETETDTSQRKKSNDQSTFEKCPRALFIRELEIKATVSHHCASTRTAATEKTKFSWGRGATGTPIHGQQCGMLAASDKMKHTAVLWHGNP